MSRRGENIYKRKDGRWEGRYKKGRKPNGRIYYGYVYGKSYNKVRQTLFNKMVEYVRVNKNVIMYEGTLEEWMKCWIIKKSDILKESTIASYTHKLEKYVYPYIGNKKLKKVTSDDFHEIIMKLKREKLSSATIQVIVILLKQGFFEARLAGLISCNPFEHIKTNTFERKKIGALTKSEQRRLEEECSISDHGLPVLLALRTGLRIGEICALKWKNVDLDLGLIYVDETYQRIPIKGCKKRTVLKLGPVKSESSKRKVPLSNQMVILMLKHFKYESSDDMFVFSINKKPVEPRLLTYYFHKIRKEAELEHINFHQLRHTFATRCLESKGDIASISALLGHSSTKQTLDIYIDSIFEQRVVTVKNMEDSLYF